MEAGQVRVKYERGLVFNGVTLHRFSHKDGNGNRYWEVQCFCGELFNTIPQRLKNGTTQSCGCKPAGTHGYYGTPTYISWCRMLQRVRGTDPRCLHFKKGIQVDPAWLEFTAFLADMGERPKGLTLDRIDNDGNYTKANCRWADSITQANNR